jgi:DNA (cytosine-5)-methyltransferase 1
MSRPFIADLYSCQGGAGMGYARAVLEPVGYDIAPQPRYPFAHHQRDVLTISPDELRDQFDAVHASPICQKDTVLRHAPGTKQHPDLITPTLDLLRASGLPWILENVEGARVRLVGLQQPGEHLVMLCGSMFGLGAQGCYLERHRLFLSNFPLHAPGPCRHDGPCIGVYGAHARRRAKAAGGRGTRDVWLGGHSAAASEALGIDWMTLGGLSESIPPAYTEWLGHQLIDQVLLRRAA